jgi:hypothetical protein
MRVTLQNQPQIERLSQPLMQALRAIVAAIQTGWSKQHSGDGAHTAVIANSLTAPVVRSRGRLIGSVAWRTRPLTANTMPLAPDAAFVVETGGAFFNVLNISGGSSPALTIHGLSAAGRELGERIVIVNGANISVFLAHNSASTPAGTRFLSGTGADVELPLYSAVEAVYAESFSPGVSGPYWVLVCGAI